MHTDTTHHCSNVSYTHRSELVRSSKDQPGLAGTSLHNTCLSVCTQHSEKKKKWNSYKAEKNPEQVPNTQIEVQNIFHHFKTADDDDDGNDKAELLAISFHSQWGRRGRHTTGVCLTHQNTDNQRRTHTKHHVSDRTSGRSSADTWINVSTSMTGSSHRVQWGVVSLALALAQRQEADVSTNPPVELCI